MNDYDPSNSVFKCINSVGNLFPEPSVHDYILVSLDFQEFIFSKSPVGIRFKKYRNKNGLSFLL